jgi:hypothetical protein
MNDELFAERLLSLNNQRVVVRVFAPTLERGGEYRCAWQIEWPNRTGRLAACGIDGIQALMLALRSLHSDLVESDEYRTGQLTYLDQHDLDLPPTWGDGPLNKAGPKPD